MNEDYEGPVPQNDHEYLVACYHLLANLSKTVSVHERALEHLEPRIMTVERRLDLHDRLFIILGAVATPLLVIVGNFVANHLK